MFGLSFLLKEQSFYRKAGDKQWLSYKKESMT